MKKKQCWAIHCHHNILVEWCYDFAERREVIRNTKAASEQPIRLKLLKFLPAKAVKEIPKAIRKAYAEWEKADAEWEKADAECRKADAECWRPYAECRKAYAEREKADAEWSAESKAIFHAKWCGCKEWNGEEIMFPRS